MAYRVIESKFNGNLNTKRVVVSTSSPGVKDDKRQGFVIGSEWVKSNGNVYRCIDDTAGAAVWELDTSASDYGSGGLKSDVIAESTATAGVTADGVLLKDGGIVASANVQALNLKSDNVIEKTSAAGVTVDGVVNKDGTVNAPSTTNDLLTGFTKVIQAGGMFEQCFLDKTYTLAAVSTDLPADIPIGAIIDCVALNIVSTLTGGGTTAKVGIGPVADPDKYGITADLVKNSDFQTAPAQALLAAAEDVQVNACTAGGAIGNTALTVGSVRVRVWYRKFIPIPAAV
jgi:hypothetical protein